MDMLIKKDTLNKISDKIRQRLNVEEHYSVLQMPNKTKEAFASNYNTEILRDFIERGESQYTIPNGVTSIGAYAFYYYASLTSITIPDSVTSIGAKAFNGCTGLKTINVPWSEGEVAGAPWGATNATINYNYTG